MRYHTAPLIAFTAYLERDRYYAGDDSLYFSPGNSFSCFISNMKVEKQNPIESAKKYRTYSRLTFVYTERGYNFELHTGGFFSRTPKGVMKFLGDNRYELERFGDYQEKWVKFRLQPTSGTFAGSYYNWHLEQGRFTGHLSGKNVDLTARGMHYRRDKSSPYYGGSDSIRDTTWEFDISLSHIQLPTI